MGDRFSFCPRKLAKIVTGNGAPRLTLGIAAHKLRERKDRVGIMIRALVFASALGSALTYSLATYAQTSQSVECRPLPGTTAAAFACTEFVNGSCSCPAGFVAVVENAPAAIPVEPAPVSPG